MLINTHLPLQCLVFLIYMYKYGGVVRRGKMTHGIGKSGSMIQQIVEQMLLELEALSYSLACLALLTLCDRIKVWFGHNQKWV